MCAGLPQPVNVRASSTNTSVTLQWELPEGIQLDEKTFYNVSFHAYICARAFTGTAHKGSG